MDAYQRKHAMGVPLQCSDSPEKVTRAVERHCRNHKPVSQ